MLLASATPAVAATPFRTTLGFNAGRTYVRARTAQALGDTKVSARLYAALSASDKANLPLAHRAIGSAIDAGSFDLAVLTARRLPNDQLGLDGRLLLIGDSLRRDKLDEALALVDAKTGEGDGGFVAPLLRAWNEAAAGRDGLAILNGAAASQGLLGPFADEQRAFLLLWQRKGAAAMPYITRALASSGGRETRLRLAFADGLRRADDAADAKIVLGEAEGDAGGPGIAITTPAAAYAELLTGIASALAQNPERALPIALGRIASATAPDSSETALLLAALLDREERRDEALAVLAPIGKGDPFISDVRDARVRLLMGLDRKAEAVATAREALADLGKAASAADWARLGDALRESEDQAGALEAYGRAAILADAAKEPNRWTFRLLRADLLEDLGRWPEAKAELQAGLAVAPNQPLLLNYLGYGQLERGESLEASEQMIRQALALKPDDPSITDSLGWALFKRGRTAEAIDTLRKATAADPVQSEIHEHLGDALYTTGRRLEARFSWAAALVNADTKDAERIKAKLDSGLSAATAAP